MIDIKSARACQLCDDWPASSADIQRSETALLQQAAPLCDGDFPIDLMECRQCGGHYVRIKLTQKIFHYFRGRYL